jgi:hypothetical protein
VKKRSIALALCCSLVCSPVCATTFIGVLWPLFGPLAAPGLVEFVAELQSMSDVEVVTYLHPSWSSLVDDIDRQPAGTHILIIGYSLGANNAVLVANNTKYIDSIIALQPSIFTPNTSLTGQVGRIVEIYNPNPWMTFGGMGSQKLVGPNIEYVVNNDIARLAAEPAPDTAQVKMPKASQPTNLAKLPETPKLEAVKEERLRHRLRARTAHVDALPSLENSADSAVQR